MNFPVLEILPDLKVQLARHKVVILQAPPGAGKSTILPLELLEEPWLEKRRVIMLEPRRLAARSVAQRMSSLREEEVGGTIGYRIRFDTKISEKTRIEVLTEGILTRMIQNDSTLEGTGLVIFDEFHERSLQGDLALAFCLQIQELLRNDLKILIMSATLDGGKLSTLLGNAPLIASAGKQFPVEHRYNNFDPEASIAQRMARAIRKALSECKGDILAFFPGAGEINRTKELLEKEETGARLCVLFGDLPMKKQQEAILPLPDGRRKVVLATSIAETSLTIEGIAVVIDSGYSRVPRFDARSGLTGLETVRVTKSSADQRAGRAGRLGPGVCYRLWSEGSNASLVPHRTPEIMEADLSPLMLELAQWGVKDVNQLAWLTPPPTGAVNQATKLLTQLEAIDGGQITERGKRMLQLPTHPRISHMLIEAKSGDSLSLATDVAAILEERDPLGRDTGADLALRVEIMRKWRAGEKVNADQNALDRIERLAQSWRKIFRLTVVNSIPSDEEVGKLIATAYPERIARQIERGSERYKLANGRIVKLPQHDPLMINPWLAVAHLDAGSGEGRVFLAAALDDDDLQQLAHETETVDWDSGRGLVVGSLEKRIGNLVLTSRPMAVIPEQKRISVLCGAIRGEGLKMIGWSDAQSAWQARVMSLRRWRPSEAWPDVSDEFLLQSLETWLSPFLSGVTRSIELLRLNLSEILHSILPWNLHSRLNDLAPAKIGVPSGSAINVNYFQDGRAPYMEVRLQEVFGLLETPAVNEGNTRIVLHLLSPGYKPVQVTQDLKSFWQTTYHDVRKELRMRYPRHSWPEDPWTAEAVRGAKEESDRLNFRYPTNFILSMRGNTRILTAGWAEPIKPMAAVPAGDRK